MTPRPFDEYRDAPLWDAVETTLNELVASSEIAVNTAPEYVIGYLCRQLQAKKLVIASSVQR